MAKATLKTQPNAQSVDAFVSAIDDEQKRADSLTIIRLMSKKTKAEPKMWGSSIIGFGERHLKYDSGREMDWFITGFSPRKQNLTLYLGLGGFPHEELVARLGKYTTGKGCLYIKKLTDIDLKMLEALVEASIQEK